MPLSFPFSVVFVVGVALLSSLPGTSAQGNDLATIKERLLNSFITTVNVSGADADVTAYLPLITPEGTFSDLNYTPGLPTGWGGYTHAQRLEEMGGVYFSNTSTWYRSPQLLAGIKSAFLTFWLGTMPQDPANWWYQMVGGGRMIGQLSLQFEDLLSAEQVVK